MIISGSAKEINKDASKFEKFQNRLKKGNSTLGLNINFVQYFETGQNLQYITSPSIEYSYFLVNRFSLNASLGFYKNFAASYKINDRLFISQKYIDLQFRYYFFKRGGFFIGLGGSFGHISVDVFDEFGRKFYVAPKFEIGYSYMITNLWKPIDNKVSLNMLFSSYIPTKSPSKFDVCDKMLPYFPFLTIDIGVVYYFLRKK